MDLDPHRYDFNPDKCHADKVKQEQIDDENNSYTWTGDD